MFLPVLAVLSHGPLVPTRHFAFVASFARRTHFNGGVLERRGCHCHLVSTLDRFNDNDWLVINHSHLHTHRNKSVKAGVYFWNSETKPSSAHLEDELYHFSVHQSVHRLPVDVGDEVTSTQAGLLGGAAVLNVLPIGEMFQYDSRST